MAIEVVTCYIPEKERQEVQDIYVPATDEAVGFVLTSLDFAAEALRAATREQATSETHRPADNLFSMAFIEAHTDHTGGILHIGPEQDANRVHADIISGVHERARRIGDAYPIFQRFVAKRNARAFLRNIAYTNLSQEAYAQDRAQRTNIIPLGKV